MPKKLNFLSKCVSLNIGVNYLSKTEKFFSKHVYYNSFIHVLAGVGIGAVLTYPVFGPHPVRWGVVLIGLAVLGHIYPLASKAR